VSERVRRYLAGEDRPTESRVGSEREGWRARLANVERLLDLAVPSCGGYGGEVARDYIAEALAEVRSMIDGD
jgi:hypothetical protein